SFKKKMPGNIAKKRVILSKYHKKPVGAPIGKPKPKSVGLKQQQEEQGADGTETEEAVDKLTNKPIKYFYVCDKCEAVHDNLGKARNHFNNCFPSGDIEFERSFTRYKQGFYGPSKCP